jgi:sporulation protein YlmC with PRC-barrel domain
MNTNLASVTVERGKIIGKVGDTEIDFIGWNDVRE